MASALLLLLVHILVSIRDVSYVRVRQPCCGWYTSHRSFQPGRTVLALRSIGHSRWRSRCPSGSSFVTCTPSSAAVSHYFTLLVLLAVYFVVQKEGLRSVYPIWLDLGRPVRSLQYRFRRAESTKFDLLEDFFFTTGE